MIIANDIKTSTWFLFLIQIVLRFWPFWHWPLYGLALFNFGRYYAWPFLFLALKMFGPYYFGPYGFGPYYLAHSACYRRNLVVPKNIATKAKFLQFLFLMTYRKRFAFQNLNLMFVITDC